MPSLSDVTSHQAMQPWTVVCSVLVASASGLWYQLDKVGDAYATQQRAADGLNLIWYSSPETSIEAYREARVLSGEILDRVLKVQLGGFLLASFLLSSYALSALVTKALFLGSLSVSESSKLAERLLKFAMLVVVFLGAVATPSPAELGTWLLWFSVMAYLRSFVGLARDRSDALLSSPSATGMHHARCVALLLGILIQDLSWMASYLAAIPRSGTNAPTSAGDRLQHASHAALWLFHSACVALEAAHALVRYGVVALDQWRARQGEEAERLWERRGRGRGREAEPRRFSFSGEDALSSEDDRGAGGAGEEVHRGVALTFAPSPTSSTSPSTALGEGCGPLIHLMDVSMDLGLHLLTLAHYAHLWYLHGMRLQLVDLVLFMEIRFLAAGVCLRCGALRRYRRMARSLEHSFADASAESLCRADCAICLDRMTAAKVLPCGHVFHLRCLQAWFQQSRNGLFSCPLCRVQVGVDGPEPRQQAARGAPQGSSRGGRASEGSGRADGSTSSDPLRSESSASSAPAHPLPRLFWPATALGAAEGLGQRGADALMQMAGAGGGRGSQVAGISGFGAGPGDGDEADDGEVRSGRAGAGEASAREASGDEAREASSDGAREASSDGTREASSDGARSSSDPLSLLRAFMERRGGGEAAAAGEAAQSSSSASACPCPLASSSAPTPAWPLAGKPSASAETPAAADAPSSLRCARAAAARAALAAGRGFAASGLPSLQGRRRDGG